ncbi:LytTR family DNA-binding domain-containing protein [Halobacillus sp. Marseille-Q1614]|uniref:LytTR family DNA-binding domain-containing protein n=1 Tax=Halobacillus sp. Marseille-Q1614 TaxID=2709134 RepID=UPI00156EC20D|nr:LytTR family DNA-binding domain-containing protein [Halobacillus sp. Marseille-Q1614]
MNVKIDLDGNYDQTSVTIHAKEWSEELEQLVQMINGSQRKRLIGMEGAQSVLLHPEDIEYVYSESGKVFAVMGKRSVELKMKLYEVEEYLKSYQFGRFSKSVIGSINHIQKFELSFNGNLCVYFTSGNKEYVSRRYVRSLKEQLTGGGN